VRDLSDPAGHPSLEGPSPPSSAIEESACSPLQRERLSELFSCFTSRRVLVVGDCMLDEYYWGQVRRISPEAPVPIFEPESASYATGGASNVAANIVALGGQASLASVIGDDDAGRQLRREIDRQGVQAGAVEMSDQRRTTVKSRYFSQSQQIIRVDREQTTPLSEEEAGRLVERVTSLLPGCGAILFSDYVKGVVTESVVRRVRAEADRAGVPLFANPKPSSIGLYRGISLVSLNQSEAEAVSGVRLDDLTRLEEVDAALRDRVGAEATMVTVGGRGVVLFCRDAAPRRLPVVPLRVYDPCGCGDSAIAAAALARASGAGWVEAAALANLAGNAKVRKLGVVPVTQPEILAVWSISRAGLNGSTPHISEDTF